MVYTAVHVVGENGDLELDELSNAQPKEADECIRDVVRPPKSALITGADLTGGHSCSGRRGP